MSHALNINAALNEIEKTVCKKITNEIKSVFVEIHELVNVFLKYPQSSRKIDSSRNESSGLDKMLKVRNPESSSSADCSRNETCLSDTMAGTKNNESCDTDVQVVDPTVLDYYFNMCIDNNLQVATKEHDDLPNIKVEKSDELTNTATVPEKSIDMTKVSKSIAVFQKAQDGYKKSIDIKVISNKNDDVTITKKPIENHMSPDKCHDSVNQDDLEREINVSVHSNPSSPCEKRNNQTSDRNTENDRYEKHSNSQERPGHWRCTKMRRDGEICNNSNMYWQYECHKCYTPKPGEHHEEGTIIYDGRHQNGNNQRYRGRGNSSRGYTGYRGYSRNDNSSGPIRKESYGRNDRSKPYNY